MLLIFKRSVIGTCQLVDKAFNVRQKKTGDANCPIDSAPIKADGELKKHVWEQAIDLAPAAFACSIHRYNLTAANCSCHEAGRHQIHPSSGHQVTAVQMEKVDKQEQAGQHKLEKLSLHPSVQQQSGKQQAAGSEANNQSLPSLLLLSQTESFHRDDRERPLVGYPGGIVSPERFPQ
ncbi:hypothetical protein T4B_11428 [Trichinella pseudospiralis]|uniref:Uncharacterized protein n=1 Tax=Trichinella pseudospiralis TaxID=6337 RepID=A0A0V1IF15_TRIPS|nr:hypothetical protein T4B_11428 [Trichinella pseudospiralis]